MKTAKIVALVLILAIGLFTLSCGNDASKMGSSTPIDSTNVNGTAPATYGANNPANDQRDSNRTNTNDTGTNAKNVHNTPR